MKVLLGLSFILTLSACTDSEIANFTTLGSSAHITCYSGATLIYEGDSTGKVATVDHSDGWQFKDKKTGKFIRVSGPCLIEN